MYRVSFTNFLFYNRTYYFSNERDLFKKLPNYLSQKQTNHIIINVIISE